MIYLIDCNGQRHLASSADGYEDCTVINPDVPPQPDDFHRLDPDTGTWVYDPELENARLLAQANANPEARIATLEARIAELEATIMVMAPLVEQSSGIDLETGEPLAL